MWDITFLYSRAYATPAAFLCHNVILVIIFIIIITILKIKTIFKISEAFIIFGSINVQF